MTPIKKKVLGAELRWQQWWKSSPIFMRDQYGRYVSQPGAEFWFENFWKPRALSAWAYELVRRLAKLPPQRLLPLSPAEKNMLESMPPYPHLAPNQKQLLYAVFTNEFLRFRGGIWYYTNQFSSSDQPTLSWRQGQVERLGEWKQIELLDLKTDDQDLDQRRLAKKYIRRFWPLIRAIWRLGRDNDGKKFLVPLPLPLKQHKFTGCFFSLAQNRRAVKACQKKAVVRSAVPSVDARE
jgi:hypothetical protein